MDLSEICFSSTQWRTWITWVGKRLCVIWPILPHWPSDVSFLHFEITLNLLSMEYCLLKRVDTLLLPVAPARLVILRQCFHDPFVLTTYTSQVVSLQVVPLNTSIFFPNQHYTLVIIFTSQSQKSYHKAHEGCFLKQVGVQIL